MRVVRRCGLTVAVLFTTALIALGLVFSSSTIGTLIVNQVLRALAGDVRVESASLGLTAVEVRGVSVGDIARVDRVELRFRPDEVLRGRMRELRIESPVIDWPESADLTGRSPGPSSDTPVLHVERLNVKEGEIWLLRSDATRTRLAGFNAELELELPDWERSSGSARIDIEVPPTPLLPLAARAQASARIDARLRDGVLEIGSSTPLQLEIESPRLPDQETLVGRVAARSSDGGARIRWQLASGDLSIDFGSLDLELEELVTSTLRLDRGRIQLDGELRVDAGHVSISLTECAPAELERLTVGDELDGLELRGCLSTGREGLELDCTNGACRPVSGHLEARIEGAAARIRDQHWRLRGASLRADAVGDGRARLLVELSELADSVGPVYANPLRFRGDLRLDPDRARLTGDLVDTAAGLEASLDTTLERSGAGELQLTLLPVHFERAGLQPEALSRHLGGILPPLDGNVAAILGAVWDGGEPQIELDLVIDGASLHGTGAHLDALSGLVHFDSLDPPRVSRWQVLSFDALGAGADLGGGMLAFRMDGDRLEILHAESSFGGGALRATGSTDLVHAQHELDLRLQQVSASALASLAAVEGLEVTGALSGELPIRVDANGLAIEEGRILSAPGGGRIRYRPASLPAALAANDPSTDLLRRALEDLRYDSLEIRVDGRSDEELIATLHVRGHSPAVASDRPIELNVNLRGDLVALLRAPLALVEVPGELYRRIRRAARD
jgi:hypothetical protein